MNVPVKCIRAVLRRSTPPFARIYTWSRISKNNLCLPTEIQYSRGEDTPRYKMAVRGRI